MHNSTTCPGGAQSLEVAALWRVPTGAPQILTSTGLSGCRGRALNFTARSSLGAAGAIRRAQINRLASRVGQLGFLAHRQAARGWHSAGTHAGCRSSSAGVAQPGHGCCIRPGKAPSIQQRPASTSGATRESLPHGVHGSAIVPAIGSQHGGCRSSSSGTEDGSAARSLPFSFCRSSGA